MSRRAEYDWIDDPFNEEKQAEELQHAQSARRIGCIIGALVLIAIIVGVCTISCSALSAMTALS